MQKEKYAREETRKRGWTGYRDEDVPEDMVAHSEMQRGMEPKAQEGLRTDIGD